MTEHVVVGVDGSESALQASRWAAREAVRRDTDVRLVHVRQLPLLLPAEDLYALELTEQGRKWLAAAREVALDAAPDIDVHTELRTGQPGEELVAATEDAGLVVVGSRGFGGFRSLLLGSVANALSAHGHCPVVVLRGGFVGAPVPEQGPVVVGVDGTPPCTDALEFALSAAAARGVEVVAVHAWTYGGFMDVRSPLPEEVDNASTTATALSMYWDGIVAAQHRVVDDQVAAARATHADVVVRSVCFRGRPLDGILGQAEHAQLVVVGVNSRHPAIAGAIGSTSYGVLHRATCPVALVRGQSQPA